MNAAKTPKSAVACQPSTKHSPANKRVGRTGAVVDMSQYLNSQNNTQQWLNTPVLSWQEAAQRQMRSCNPSSSKLRSMYSSVVGGIITNPGLMTLPINESLTSGYAVTEVCHYVNGYAYLLTQHISRLIQSAECLSIPLPHPAPVIRRIVLETIAASLTQNGMVTLYLTAGPDAHGPPSTSRLFVLVEKCDPITNLAHGPVEVLPVPWEGGGGGGVLEQARAPSAWGRWSDVEAVKQGKQMSVWVDSSGTVRGSANAVVAIVTRQKELIIQQDSNSVGQNVIVDRLTEVLPPLLPATEDHLRIPSIDTTCTQPITNDDALNAQEIILIGCSRRNPFVTGVGLWGEAVIGDGELGPAASEVQTILHRDLLGGGGGGCPRGGALWVPNGHGR